MPFCSSCGEIVRDNRICPQCGGQVKVGLTSGFASSSPSSTTTTVPITRPSTDQIIPSTTINVSRTKDTVIPVTTPASGSSLSSIPKSDPVPVNARTPDHHNDVVLCCMCLEKLDPERAKKSSQEPNKVYCHGCWAIRPIPDKNPTSSSSLRYNARQELDYQTLRGSSHDISSNPSIITPTKCSTCNLSLGVGTHIIAFNKQFHSSCFQCISCKQPPGDVFINRNDMPLCKSCHSKEIRMKVQDTVANEYKNKVPVSIPGVFANRPTCNICQQPIFTAIVTLHGGEQRCTDCFICDKCKKPLEGSYVKKNGTIMHSDCVSGTI